MKIWAAAICTFVTACEAAPAPTPEWINGSWRSHESTSEQRLDLSPTTLWLYAEGQDGSPDVLVIDQHRIEPDGRCLRLRTNGALRVFRMRFHQTTPASPEIVALSRGKLNPGPDLEFRACRDGETLRFLATSESGEVQETRYDRLTEITALPLSPPSRSDLEGVCGITCNAQSPSRFNACFSACRQAVAELPPLQNPALGTRQQDTVVTVSESATRQLTFHDQIWEIRVWAAANAVRGSHLNEDARISDDNLMRFIFGSRSDLTDQEAQLLVAINAETIRNGASGFLTQLPDPTPPTTQAPEASDSPERDATNTLSASSEAIVSPRWITRPTAAEIARYYPERAQEQRVEGSATIECLVQIDTRLSCSVTMEEPSGFGFGEAAIRASQNFRASPATRNGEPVTGGRIRQTLHWQLPD